MTTRQISFLSEILNGERIPIGKLAYFRARLSNTLHRLVLREFGKLSQDGKINKSILANRIGRKPEQVTRWLGGPSNLTLDTISDLLLGMGYEPTIALTALADAKSPVSVTHEATNNVVYAFPTKNKEAIIEKSGEPWARCG
jgi:hypothetical protein